MTILSLPILNDQSTPYAHLDPMLILDAIESVGFHCTGGLISLNSYENRVYQISIEDEKPIVAKFYRPHRWTNAAILEEHQFAAELSQHEMPVIAPIVSNGETLHEYQGFRFALFPRQGGRALEVDNLDHLEWMGRFIGRLHAIGACRPFQSRIHLDVDTYGIQPYQFLLENGFIPLELRHNYCSTVESLLEEIARSLLYYGPINDIRLHGDCHAGNVLWNTTGPYVVDLDDCLMGPAIQDIWMLLSGGSAEDIKIQLNCILKGYRKFHDFNDREIHLIEALRTLRMIYYSGWLAKRWVDPAFPLHFPWFNTPRYWQEQLQHLREQVCLLTQAMEEK